MSGLRYGLPPYSGLGLPGWLEDLANTEITGGMRVGDLVPVMNEVPEGQARWETISRPRESWQDWATLPAEALGLLGIGPRISRRRPRSVLDVTDVYDVPFKELPYSSGVGPATRRQTLDLLENPTERELEELIAYQRRRLAHVDQNDPTLHAVRVLRYGPRMGRNVTYAWSAYDALHQDIMDWINKSQYGPQQIGLPERLQWMPGDPWPPRSVFNN